MKNEEELYLMYVLEIGENFEGNWEYEFLFTESPTDIDILGWNWDVISDENTPTKPEHERVDKIIRISVPFKMNPLHDSLDFTYQDGYFQVISILYEDMQTFENQQGMNKYEEIKRLVFHYGDTLDEVKEKLKNRKITYNI